MPDAPVSEPTGILRAALVSVPALVAFPLNWLANNARPLSSLWYFANQYVWVSLAAPLSLVLLLVMWRSFRPRTTLHRAILISLLLLNIAVVLASLGILSQLSGL